MKNNKFKKLAVVIVVILLISLTSTPVLATSTGTVNVRFVVNNQQGPYKNVQIQFGNNTKNTNRRGIAEFRLKDIPTVTTIMAHLADPNIPAGYHSSINLGLGAHEFAQVVTSSPGSCELNIIYNDYTDTIIIEYSVGPNSGYGYKNVTFDQKNTSSTKPTTAPSQPQSQSQPGEDPDAHHDGPDPDMHHEDFNDDMHHDGFDPDMHHEEFNDSMPFNEGNHDEFDRNQYTEPRMPSNYKIIILFAALLLILAIVLIVILVTSKRKA